MDYLIRIGDGKNFRKTQGLNAFALNKNASSVKSLIKK